MQNTNRILALIVLGLVVGLGLGAATLRAQESDQAVPVAMASVTPELSGMASASSDGGLVENGTPENAVPTAHGACWKQAGLSKNVMEQRKSIVSGAKAQIRSIESDPTLTLPQQKQQIRQIRMSARQDIGKLLTPDQQEALRQCHQERAEERAASAPASAPLGSGNPSSGISPAPENSTDSSQPK